MDIDCNAKTNIDQSDPWTNMEATCYFFLYLACKQDLLCQERAAYFAGSAVDFCGLCYETAGPEIDRPVSIINVDKSKTHIINQLFFLQRKKGGNHKHKVALHGQLAHLNTQIQILGSPFS